MVVRGFLESLEMASPSGNTTQEVPFQGVPFILPPSEGIFPPFVSTLNLPGLSIGLSVWMFNLVIPITSNVSNVTSPPGEDQPQPNPAPSFHLFLLLRLTKALWLVVMWIRRRREE